MKIRLLFILTFLMISVLTFAQKPTVYIMDADRLVSLKNKYQQKDQSSVHIIDDLVKRADVLLKMKPVSVMEKEFAPVSGNKHDYMSQAPYFWYDSTKPKGLPYYRKDGERNPEINKITDKKNLVDLENATRTLALAYYLTAEEKYAQKAAALIRHWFFDEATKMNPNFEYAQGIPGINHGRGIGIIESRSFTGIADATGLMQGSKSWTDKDAGALKDWYKEFLHWMLNSKNGKEEHAAKNNHGTWYYVQVIDFALFTGDHALAKSLAKESLNRLDSQLTADGQQPLELDRTKALGYSTMNLRGWFEVAKLGEHVGVDLWNYKTSKNASLKKALDWLKPYAMGEKKWEYEQIEKYNLKEIYPLLLQAAYKFNDMSYLKAVDEKNSDAMIEILYRR